MNDDTRHDRTAELISALAAHPERPRPDDVDPGQWARLRDLAGIERDLRADAAAAPPLERDPVAALLGLIPDAHAPEDPDASDRQCAWADYRKDYGVGEPEMVAAHKAFMAGWKAAREGDQSGPLR